MKFPVYVFTNMLPFGYRTAHFLLGGWEVAGAETVPFLCSSILCLLINTTVTTLKSAINGIRAGPRIRLSSEIRPSSFLTGANSLTQWFGCGFLLGPGAVRSRSVSILQKRGLLLKDSDTDLASALPHVFHVGVGHLRVNCWQRVVKLPRWINSQEQH